MYARAPTLAWLLTALACFLAGMAVVEGRHQAVALPVVPPVGVVVTVEVAFQPTATPEPTPRPTLAPTRNLWDPYPTPISWATPPLPPGGTGNVR